MIAVLLLFIGFVTFSNAQTVYNPFYFVDGKILPPIQETNVSTEERTVIFYQTTSEAGYASDISGNKGRSGRNGNFMLNIMEDKRMKIIPGEYKIAVVKGEDGYGSNPVNITITGNGYDTSPDLILAKDTGITSPTPQPAPFEGEAPVIESIRFDGRLYQKNLINKEYEYIVSKNPIIEVKVTAGNTGIDISTLAMSEDAGSVVGQYYKITDDQIITRVMGTNNPVEVTFAFDYKAKNKELSSGAHTFNFEAGNSVGTTSESATVKIMAGDTEIIGTPIAFPSPFILKEDTKVTLQYGLSDDANIDIYIFDITAKVVKKLSYNAGTPGGSAGGTANPNKVEWDLISDFGYKIGAGVYLWHIIDRDRNKIIGKGKLAIYP